MKLCLIGTGSAANNIAKNIKKINNSKIIAVCGTSKDHTKKFANKHNIPNSYNSLQEMLNKEKEIQGAIIATIPTRHFKEIVLCSKHTDFIIVEKPVVTSIKEVNELKNLLKNKNITISVNYQMRYSKGYKKLKEEFNKNKSKINYINLQFSHFRDKAYFSNHGSWRKSKSKSAGGVLLQQGIHWLNLICSITGYNSEILASKASFKDGIETENSISTNLLIDNKIKFDIFMSRDTHTKQTQINFFGENTSFSLKDYKFSKINPQTNILNRIKSIISRKSPLLLNFSINSYSGRYYDFLSDAIKNKNKSLFLEDAFNDIILIENIYKKS